MLTDICNNFFIWDCWYNINPLSAGGEHSMLPLSEISSCALGTDFLVAPNGWQFLSMNIFEGYFPSWAINCLGRVLELFFWARGHFRVSKSECNLYFWSYNVMSHRAGSSFLILWILQENGLLGMDRGYYGSPRPYSAKSDKSNFGQKSIFAIFWGPNLAKNEVSHQNMQR